MKGSAGGGAAAAASPASPTWHSAPRLLPLLPPSLALLYSASVHAFQAAWHDVAWSDRERRRSIAGRAGVLLGAAAAVGAVSALGGGRPPASASASAAAACSRSTSSSSSLSSLSVGTLAAALTTAASAHLIHRTRQRHVQGPHRTGAGALPPRSLGGRVYLVTGANAGVGYETARQLHEAGATVVLGCRSEGRAREAMGRIRRSASSSGCDASDAERGDDGDDDGDNDGDNDNDNDNYGRRLLFVRIDVSDLASVREAARRFQSLSLPLHGLVLNAGIMMADRRDSVDGHELTLAANHLGHFLLTNLLLPSMRTVDDPRVVVLTSSTYRLAAPGIALDDLHCRQRPYTMFSQYAQTKLANILFVKELARREEQLRLEAVEKAEAVANDAVANDAVANDANDDAKSTGTATVKAYAVHPGLVRTDVVRNMPWYLYYPNTIFGFAVAALQKTPEAGAWTTVFCATSADVLDESGSYYVNSRREPVEDFADDDKVSSSWDVCERRYGKSWHSGWSSLTTSAANQTIAHHFLIVSRTTCNLLQAASKLWSLSEELVGLKR